MAHGSEGVTASSEALHALFKGEDSVDAEVGSLLLAEALYMLRKYLGSKE